MLGLCNSLRFFRQARHQQRSRVGSWATLRYTEEEIVGQSVTILIPPDRQSEEPAILARLKRGERVEHFETVRRRKDGALLDISLTISPVKDEHGRIIGASKIARDVTQAKRMEAKVQQANKDLEQFAFSASHDLQEPLRNVTIFTQLLTTHLGDKLDVDATQYLRFIHAGATRMEALVRDLLSYTRASGEETAIDFTNTDDALAQTIEAMAAGINAAGARITHDDLPPVRMRSLHLQQLFQNLIGNALKYCREGTTPEIHVGGERSGTHCIISVADNGIGIDPEFKEHIFGLFKRLHTSDTYDGTGIGLAICQRLVDRYYGRIWVDSAPGQGSTFRFAIPC